MCADEDIDLTLGEVFQQGGGLLGGAGSREIVHPHRHILQARGEGAIVLIGQHRSGHHHRHLLAIDGSLEGSTHSHLGLAKAHIAAHQAVHRFRLLHIGLHVLRGLELVGGILVEERRLELVLKVGVVAEGEAFLMATGRIELDEVARYILDMLLGTLLEALPLACAQR